VFTFLILFSPFFASNFVFIRCDVLLLLMFSNFYFLHEKEIFNEKTYTKLNFIYMRIVHLKAFLFARSFVSLFFSTLWEGDFWENLLSLQAFSEG
jgi:hypothetical protein